MNPKTKIRQITKKLSHNRISQEEASDEIIEILEESRKFCYYNSGMLSYPVIKIKRDGKEIKLAGESPTAILKNKNKHYPSWEITHQNFPDCL